MRKGDVAGIPLGISELPEMYPFSVISAMLVRCRCLDGRMRELVAYLAYGAGFEAIV